MSSPRVFSADRFYLSLNRSRAHSLLKFATHMAALVALWVNPIFWLPLQWALTLALFTSLIHLAHKRNHLGKTLVVEQVVFRDEKWSLGFSDGRWQEAELRSPLHVGYFFVNSKICICRAKNEFVIIDALVVSLCATPLQSPTQVLGPTSIRTTMANDTYSAAREI